MMRKITIGGATTLLFLVSTLAFHHRRATAAQTRPATAPLAKVYYVASKVRFPFHRPDCKWAAKINPKNLEVFATREDAIAAGHRPCKECQP